jgi:hypothetical protein
MKSIFTSLLVLTALIAGAQSYNSPESVKYDANHQRYIVSNTGADNLQQVVPGSAPTLFVNNVPSPYGLTIVGDTVYVCCNSSHLRGYNLTTGALAFDVNLGGSFLNGICSDDAGNIYVTDFSAKKVFRYNIASQLFNYFVGTAMAKTPNGIIHDAANNQLIIATWGSNAPILGLSLADSTISTLKTTSLTNIDGIGIDGDGNVYAADWGTDGVYFFDAAFANAPVKVVTGLSNPADMSYNQLTDTVAVPNTSNNTVTFHGFARPVAVADADSATVGTPKAICVIQNDVISSNVSLTLQDVSTAQFGTAVVSGNCINYTGNSVGTENLTYTICSVDTPSFCTTGNLVITVTDSLPNGIENIALSNISMFPNPANAVLTIDMKRSNDEITNGFYTIEIINAIGEVQKTVSAKAKTITLDVKDLPNGMYLATISGEKQRKLLGKFNISK